jgi:hypothetical protein
MTCRDDLSAACRDAGLLPRMAGRGPPTATQDTTRNRRAGGRMGPAQWKQQKSECRKLKGLKESRNPGASSDTPSQIETGDMASAFIAR